MTGSPRSWPWSVPGARASCSRALQGPAVSWGAMIEQGRAHLLDGWWLTTFPGLAITATVVGWNLLGDGLREALDPRVVPEGGELDRGQAARS